MEFFKHKTYIITGASRGIGKAIALKLGASGANVVIAAKSVKEDPRLGGTIYSAASEIEAAGGRALPVACDVRDDFQVQEVVRQAVAQFGGIDGVINNASAISLSDTARTPMKRYDLMMDINVRGTFFMVKSALPYLGQSGHAHILTLSPPLNLQVEWLKGHAAYTISKYNMTLFARAWAAELAEDKIAANALWPVTTIATAAIRNLPGGDELIKKSRRPAIVADAVHYILQQDPSTYTGMQLLDEAVLREAGITDFEPYRVSPEGSLQRDFFLD